LKPLQRVVNKLKEALEKAKDNHYYHSKIPSYCEEIGDMPGTNFAIIIEKPTVV
jgi:hypothetical protein